MRLALVLPPLTQLNTPYPSTAYLARHLRGQGLIAHQRDLGILLARRVFSAEGLGAVFDAVQRKADATGELPEPAWRALALRSAHTRAIDPVMRFLAGEDRTLAPRILGTPLLPQGPRLQAADPDAFGSLAVDDAARHLATLYLEDLADLVTATVDPGFALARYQHHLAVGPVSFDPIAARLEQTTLIDGWLDELVDQLLAEQQPEAVGISVPFPGTLVGALRIGRRLRAAGVKVWMGGGYVSTELREVDEPRLWECVDALSWDDGEGPLQALLDHAAGLGDRRHRTRTREGRFDAPSPRVAFTSAAWYGDLPLRPYLQVLDTVSPAHRLWSDGRWNRITLAHGCYWRRCAFCDTSLDYIARFEPARVGALVDAMEELVGQTGTTGFHFVDEAAPPRVMRDLALEILRRGLSVSWWGNIRFEEAFTPDLCRLLATAGLVAVTGGLEVASDRLLRLMDKGITVEQAARASHAFRQAGVLVHAYLMYGFPTETEQETIDAMEVVRQLFAEDLLSSAFWHRFVLTRHAPVYADPGRFHVTVPPIPPGTFATNDLPHLDPTGADHDRFDEGLARSLSAWMRHQELDAPVARWFAGRVPRTTEAPDRVRRFLSPRPPSMQPEQRLVWLGGDALESEDARGPCLVLFHAEGEEKIHGKEEELAWLEGILEQARPEGPGLRMREAEASCPCPWPAMERRWRRIRRAGMVAV